MTSIDAASIEATSDAVAGSTRTRRKRRRSRLLQGLAVPVSVLLLWQGLAYASMIDVRLFPAPVEVFAAFVELLMSGELLSNFLVSLGRASIGFVFGASIGLGCGLLVGCSKSFEGFLDPTFQMLRTVPLLAVTPLFILWFGFGDQAKIILIATGSFFPMYVNTFLGVRNVDSRLLEVTRVLEFSRFERLLRLTLPGAMPNILLGVRLSIGVSWLCLVVAELMGAQSGLGYLIQNARSLLDTPTVIVGIIAFAAIGKGSDSLVKILEKRLLRWNDGYRD